MKPPFRFIAFFVSLLLLSSYSCKKGESLSEKRAKERAAIAQLIADSAYVITETMPPDTLFDKKEYYHSPSGLYLHIINKGTGRKPQTNDNVIFRYYMYDVQWNLITAAMTSAELYNAPKTKFNSGEIPTGLNEAIACLGTDGAAYAIVPSAIGSQEAQTYITTYIYEIRHIKIE